MKTESVIERLDACIQFMEEVKQFVLSATMHGVEGEPITVTVAEIAKKQQVEKQEELAAAEKGTEENPYEDLQDMTEEDLEGILEAYEIKLPRRVKTRDHKIALMDAVLKGIADGVIEVEDDESADESDGQEASGTGEEVPAETDNEDSETGNTDGNDESGTAAPAETDSDPAELSELQEALKEAIVEGEIKMSEIKKFLSAHFKGDDDCAECKGCGKEDTVDCYLQTMEIALTDDDGDVHAFEEPYLRNEEVFCCGLPCTEKKGRYYCQGHCKQDFELED